MKLMVRALIAVLLLPGVAAGIVPVLLVVSTGAGERVRIAGIGLAVTGVAGLARCVWDVFAAGRGTLAPWDPPRRLVIVGLYRFTRNPMYLSVLTIVVGWAWAFGSWPVALYAMGLAITFHLRVVLKEEPVLARQFGDEWTRYAREVARWIPKWPHIR